MTQGQTMKQEFMDFCELNTRLIIRMDFISDQTLTFQHSRGELRFEQQTLVSSTMPGHQANIDWCLHGCYQRNQTQNSLQLPYQTGTKVRGSHQIFTKILIPGIPFFIEANEKGKVLVMVHNCPPIHVTLEWNKLILYLDNVTDCNVRYINRDNIQ